VTGRPTIWRQMCIGLVTPRGATGMNIVPLLSTGSGLTNAGVWAQTGSDYTIDGISS
jgi:hypothetical protein